MTASSGQAPRQPSHSKQLPQDRQRPASKAASSGVSPATHLVEGDDPGRRVELGLLAPVVVAEVPEVELVEARERVLVRRRAHVSPRSQASMLRAARLPCPTPTVTVRSLGHRVAAGEDARGAGHQRGRSTCTVVAVELDARDACAGSRCRSPGRARG